MFEISAFSVFISHYYNDEHFNFNSVFLFQESLLFDKILLIFLQVGLLRTLPTRLLSRAWGTFHQVELPVFLRRPLLGLYVWAFSCDLEEAVEEDLRNYQNLGSFFKRSLKPGKREIDHTSTLVSFFVILFVTSQT